MREKKPSLQELLRNAYFSFFFMRSWLLWPHFFFLQLTALMGRRA